MCFIGMLSCAATRGRLSAAEVQAVMSSRNAEYRTCYEDGLRRNPYLTGRMLMHFVVEPDGTISEADADRSDLPDQRVIECVARHVKRLRFPEPKGGGIVDVVYPITFSPGGQSAQRPGP